MRFGRIKAALAGFVVAAGITVAACPAARADEDQPFLTLATTDVMPPGEAELEQTLFWRAGHAGQSFNQIQSFTELEYGATRRLQTAVYLTNDWSRTRPPGAAADSADFTGVQAEFVYQFLNPHTDGIGLGLYVEPSYSAAEHGIETRLLLQKNLLTDRLRTVLNINFEDTWEKDAGIWNKVSALEFDFGAAYALTPHWTAALEFDNERGFDGLILGGPAREVASAFFLGPTLQYSDDDWVVIAGVQTQLPVATGATVGGFVADAERFRLGLRVSREL